MNRIVAVVAAGVVGGVLAVSTPTAATPQPHRIEMYVPESAPTHVDHLEDGVGAGDWLLFQDPVLAANGQTVGTAVTRVQVVAPVGEGDLVFILDCTIELADGRLVFGGAEQFSRLGNQVVYPLTGGTGRYAGVQGQVVGTPAKAGDRPAARMTFEIVKK